MDTLTPYQKQLQDIATDAAATCFGVVTEFVTRHARKVEPLPVESQVWTILRTADGRGMVQIGISRRTVDGKWTMSKWTMPSEAARNLGRRLLEYADRADRASAQE